MLNITGKAANGCHDLQSTFLFLPDVYDVLVLDTTCEFHEDSARISGIPDNLNSIKKAAQILKQHFDFTIPHVEIIKKTPQGAGLGGGSSDSACFINTVLNIWKISLKDKIEFAKKTQSLGADNSVFLHKYFYNEDMILLDENSIKNINLKSLQGLYVLLANNGKKLSTKNVFDNYKGPFDEKIHIDCCSLEFLRNSKNSLENSAINLEPSIQEILEDLALTNPIFYRMSGSGTTCFGVYGSKIQAIDAKATLDLKGYSFVEISEIL